MKTYNFPKAFMQDFSRKPAQRSDETDRCINPWTGECVRIRHKQIPKPTAVPIATTREAELSVLLSTTTTMPHGDSNVLRFAAD